MKKIIVFFIGLFILTAPMIVFSLPSIPLISYYFVRLNLSNGEFFDVILNFLSLEITLALGIIVYFQSQKINKLESTQYQTYFDVENLDYSYTFSDQMLLNSISGDLSISHFFTPNKKEIITNISFLDDSTIPTKNKVFPLIFAVKNNPIITSIHFQGVFVTLIHDGKQIAKRKFTSKSDPLHLTLYDGNKIIVGFGITYSQTYSFDEIRIVFSLVAEDQIGNKTKLAPFASLNKDQNEAFFLMRQ